MDTQMLSLMKKVAVDAAQHAIRLAKADKGEQPEYLTTKDAAEYLGVSTQYLEIARHKGKGPKYSKLPRLVKYKRSDLDAWMADQAVDPENE